MLSWSPTSLVIVGETISAQQREQSVIVRALGSGSGRAFRAQEGKHPTSGDHAYVPIDKPKVGGWAASFTKMAHSSHALRR